MSSSVDSWLARLRTVLRTARRELWPSFFETSSLVSAAYIGSLAADIANFWLAVTFLFSPIVFIDSYLLLGLIRRRTPSKRPAGAVGFDEFLLGVSTGFLFGSTYSLEKLAVTNPSVWVLVVLLFFPLFIFTWGSVLAKRTVKATLGGLDTGKSPVVRSTMLGKSVSALVGLVLVGLLAVVVYLYRDSINSALGSTIASQVLLVILIFVDAVGGVAVPLLTRRADRRSQDLLRHYNDLKSVLIYWRDSGCTLWQSCTFRQQDLVDALAPLYLVVGLSTPLGNPLTYMRAVQHLQAERYQTLRSVMSRIYQLEDDHNVTVSLLIAEITENVRQKMLLFPTLSDWKFGARSNFYRSGNIVSAIEQQAKIGLVDESTNVYWDGNIFADVADPRLSASLRNEVSQLVGEYASRIKDLRDDKARVDDLLSEMRGQLAQVLDQIDTYRSLDGKCDFESSLH